MCLVQNVDKVPKAKSLAFVHRTNAKTARCTSNTVDVHTVALELTLTS